MDERKKNPIGRILKWCVFALIILIYGTYMVRIMSTCETGDVKIIYLNEYASSLKNTLKDEFSLYRISVQEYITKNGLYAVSSNYTYYLESTNQLQLTFRNKKSNLEELALLYDMNESEPFVFILRNEAGTEMRGRCVGYSQTSNYTYHTVLFDNVYIDKSKSEITYESTTTSSAPFETDENGIAITTEAPPKHNQTLHFYMNYNGANGEYSVKDHFGSIVIFEEYTGLTSMNIMSAKTQNIN